MLQDGKTYLLIEMLYIYIFGTASRGTASSSAMILSSSRPINKSEAVGSQRETPGSSRLAGVTFQRRCFYHGLNGDRPKSK
jgi:hypothetical protein